MRARTFTLVLLALAWAIAACQPAAPELPQEDLMAIRALTDSWHDAFNAGDYDALVQLYTEDAVMMPPNQAAAEGRAAVQAWLGEFPTTSEVSLTIVNIDGRGDLAYVRGTYSLTITMEGMPEAIRDTGKYLEIRRRQPDGSWPIAVDIYNSDLALPEMGAAEM